MNTTDHNSNNTVLLTIVSILLWLLLFLIILASFGICWWLGLTFCAIVIVTHFVIYALEQSHFQYNPQNVINPTTIKTHPASTRAAVCKSTVSSPAIVSDEIDKRYFADIEVLVALLMDDYRSLLKLKDIHKLIDSCGITFSYNGANVEVVSTKLNMLFWLDMTHCYLGLNNQIDLNSRSGFGLYDIILHTLGGSIPIAQNIAASKAVWLAKIESIVKSARVYFDKNIISQNEFLIAKILENYPELRKRYLTHIFRFASIAAKADNKITAQEAEWLVNIVKMESVCSMSYNKEIDTMKTKEIIPSKSVSTSSAMNELKSLVGLVSVKEEVEKLGNFIKIQHARSEKGIKTTAVSYHCVFTGNPGTGKTTVARILAKIYKGLGVVSKGHLVETDRAGLVAEYVGQTAVRTNSIIDSALDGVLFIDEAYSLVQGNQNDFGKEAIATLLKRMEDDRDRLIVIIAGYTKEMKDFINANPGLESRFNRYIEFPDYSAEELLQIFMNLATQSEYNLSNEAKISLTTYFEYRVANKDNNFGNGRLVRNVFEKTMELQANRLARETSLTTDKLMEILPEDLPIKK